MTMKAKLDPALTAAYEAAAIAAVMAAPLATEMAKVNHFDNFHVATCGTAHDGVMTEFDAHAQDEAHVAWFTLYVKGATVAEEEWRFFSPSKSSLLCRWCRIAYDRLRQ